MHAGIRGMRVPGEAREGFSEVTFQLDLERKVRYLVEPEGMDFQFERIISEG